MDPVSILGVASSSIQIIDFSAKLWSRIRRLYESESDVSESFESIHTDALRLQSLNSRLSGLLTAEHLNRSLTPAEAHIVDVCSECDSAAGQLLNELNPFFIKAEEEHSSSSESEFGATGGKRKRVAFFSSQKQHRRAKKRKAFFHKEWSAIRTAVREVWVRKDIEKLYQRVESTRKSLADTILLNIQQEILKSNAQSPDYSALPAKWGGAKTVGEWLESDVATTDQRREELMNTLNETNVYVEARDFQKIQAWSTSPVSKSLVDGVLDSLAYEGMSDREESINQAFSKTFQWIYSEPRDQSKPWDGFAKWLTNDQGIYWITGKAGSGKSTLMKLLFRQPRTKTLLNQWRGDDSLVSAAFFFWNSGFKLQKSTQGLLRSILHQAISQRLRLPSGTFRNKLEAFQLSLLSTGRTQWQWQDLLQAFRFLVEEDASVKYAFFFDGLDEFDGDQSELVSLVNTLGSYPNVKVCVSSRPWVVFEDAFKRQPSLILQHLTFDDIRNYVQDTLTATPAFREISWGKPESASNMVNTITTKASGVFLWVVLVVRSLLEGLADGDRISDLQARLEELPEQLEELFKKTLHGLKGKYFHDAARLFRIQQASTSLTAVPVTLLTMSFADEEDMETCRSRPVAALSTRERFVRATRLNRRLNSRCKGLLEAVPLQGARQTMEIWNSRDLDTLIAESESGNHVKLAQLDRYGTALASCGVQYLHRTVKDYLALPEVSELMEKACADDLHPMASLGIATLMGMKTLEMTRITSSLARREFYKHLELLFNFAAKLSACDKAQYINLLDVACTVTREVASRKCHNGLTICQDISSLSPKAGEWPCTSNSRDNTFDFLAFAVRYHFLTYVEAKLKQHPPRKDDISRLLHIAVSANSRRDMAMPSIDLSKKRPTDQLMPEPEMVRCLLSFGADPGFCVDNTSSIQIVANCKAQEGTAVTTELDEILSMLRGHDRFKPHGHSLAFLAKRRP